MCASLNSENEIWVIEPTCGLPVQQVRQLPVRRKFTDKRRFGVRRGPLVLPRAPSVAANINALPIINNKDDILFLPGTLFSNFFFGAILKLAKLAKIGLYASRSTVRHS